MYYVYVLTCRDGSLYTGVTTDPQRRFREHCGELPGGAKYTRAHPPAAISGLWQCEARPAACRLEALIKRLPRAQKLALLASPDSLQAVFQDRLRGEPYIPVDTKGPA